MTSDSGSESAASDRDAVQRWIAVQSGVRRLSNRLFEEATDRTGLPASSLQVILILASSPPAFAIQMSQLARELGFTTAGITKVTARLVRSGLIERVPCDDDRRVVRACLTDQGHQMAAATTSILGDVLNREVISRMGREEFDQMAQAMHVLDRPGTP